MFRRWIYSSCFLVSLVDSWDRPRRPSLLLHPFFKGNPEGKEVNTIVQFPLWILRESCWTRNLIKQ